MNAVREISDKFTEEKLDPKLGQKRNEIIANPGMRYDYSLIQITDEKIMGMASDDAIYISKLPPDKSAYLTFHKSADKLGSSGVMPEYLGVSVHMPSGIEEDALSHFWNSLNMESKKFQVAITGRNVSVSEETKEPFVGGTTIMGTSMKAFHVTPRGAVGGDRILMTKTSGLEATTLLSHLFPEFIEEKIGEYNQKMAQKLFFKTSSLQEEQEALKFGLGKNGVTSMKAVRDRGVLGALEEYSRAGGFGVEVDFDQIPVYDEVKEICELFELDPYRTSSMGALLLTLPEEVAEDFSKALIGNGIDVADIGKIDRESNLVKLNGYKEHEDSSNDGRSFYNLFSAFEGKA
ncbi:hypothetical protein IX51_10195 [uncultured archaeon]|nr:hypothetical protein IX51_10195 [uncultured archaeon]